MQHPANTVRGRHLLVLAITCLALRRCRHSQFLGGVIVFVVLNNTTYAAGGVLLRVVKTGVEVLRHSYDSSRCRRGGGGRGES